MIHQRHTLKSCEIHTFQRKKNYRRRKNLFRPKKKKFISSQEEKVKSKMNVVNFLKSNSVDALKANYSVRAKVYPTEGLIVLNYLNTPQSCKIANECRGLILSTKDFRVISRSFDRFFNYNENSGHDSGISKLTDKCYAVEKIDGSIIKIYHFNGMWHVSTRGTAFGECTIATSKTTYKEAIFEALEFINPGGKINEHAERKFQQFCKDCGMNTSYSYILELTGKMNRIVTEYNPNKYELWLLGIRNNDTVGKYIDVNTVNLSDTILRPKSFIFDNIDECIEEAKNLRDYKEGFVVYNNTTFEPIVKVKSPSYVIAHNSTNCMFDNTTKNIYKMILNGESTEFLAYFPHYKETFDEYEEQLKKYFDAAQMEYEKFSKSMLSNTDFRVFESKPWKSCAIQSIKNRESIYDNFRKFNESFQIKFIKQNIMKK